MAKRKYNITKEILNKLYWEDKLTIQEIANKFGCSYTTVRCRCVEYGIKIPYAWKGEKASYNAKHVYVRRLIKPKYCTICNIYSKKLHMASIDHTYTRNPKDYIPLCPSCHKLFDKCRRRTQSLRSSNRTSKKGKI